MQKRCFSTQHRCIVTACLLLFSCSWLGGSLLRVVPHTSGLVLSVQPCTIVVTLSCWLSFRKKKRSWSYLLRLLKAADVKLARDEPEMKNRHLNTLYTHWCSVCIVYTNTHPWVCWQAHTLMFRQSQEALMLLQTKLHWDTKMCKTPGLLIIVRSALPIILHSYTVTSWQDHVLKKHNLTLHCGDQSLLFKLFTTTCPLCCLVPQLISCCWGRYTTLQTCCRGRSIWVEFMEMLTTKSRRG